MKVVLLALLLVDATLLGAAELLYLPMHIGAVPVPLTALIAAVTMPWLVREAADLGEAPLVAVSPLLVWLGTIGVLAFVGPGQDVLFPDGWRPLVLLAAGILPAVWALAGARSAGAGTGVASSG
ncbi:MAG: hypothetical protein H0W01_07510 [Pseudonocardiales bacterium]|nr:hypothetical protein [Pseudonocardiales bacterium]